MKIHGLLMPKDIELDFAPNPGQESPSLISLTCSRISAASIDAIHFQEDELRLMHGNMSEGLSILHNLSEVVKKPFLALALIYKPFLQVIFLTATLRGTDW